MLSHRLKTLRADRGWTQKELAKKAGVSQQLITKIECGRVTESRKLPKLAAAFGLSVEEMLQPDAAAHAAEGSPSSLAVAAGAPRWPFGRVAPEVWWNSLDAPQRNDIEEMVEDRIARFLARHGPGRRRKSRSAARPRQ